MYKKLLGKVANAGTVALIGYEFGVHNKDEEHEHKSVESVEKESDHTEIILLCLIVLIVILVAILVKLLYKKRAIV